MNINELNRVRTINIDEQVADVVAGSGTYREIHEKVFSRDIIPIQDNYGNIIGISYDSKVTNLIDDNIAQVAFEKRYRGINVMRYVLTALQLLATNANVAEIQEDEMGERVVLANGEVIIVRERHVAPAVRERLELPNAVEITAADLDVDNLEGVTIADVKRYLREKYDHYLSGNYEDPDMAVEDDVIKVTNIYWGRKR